MKKIIVFDIKWDCGDEDLSSSLPNSVIIQGIGVNKFLDENGDINDEFVSDFLSATYGFCHYGFELKLE